MKYGFIGCGNMGGAIAKAMSQGTDDILLTSSNGITALQLAAELNVESGSNTEAAEQCDYLFLGVKPHMIRGVLSELRGILLSRRPVLISMAAGIEIKTITEQLDSDYPVVRIMPNTPVSVGTGVVLYCRNDAVTDNAMDEILTDMRFCGELIPMDEPHMDAACALSGCGPAFVYQFIEALADGAVACGLKRGDAMKLACLTLEGAAKLCETSGKHPGQLKDEVCSPGGSTIEGVLELEKNGFRGAVSGAVRAAFEKNGKLGKG